MSRFDEKLERRNTGCMKWDVVDESFGAPDELPLWVADMDFETPKAVTDALIRRCLHGAFGYPIVPKSYYEAIIGWMRRRHGWEIKREWICFTPGVIPALYWAVEAFTAPEDTVLVQSPVYYMFYNAIKAKGRGTVCNVLKPTADGYRIDFEDLEAKLADPKVTMMIFCSPHNPVGRVWTREELMEVGWLCVKHGVLLVSDEIHADLVYKGHKHIPMASLGDEIAANTITCTAPSKTFNLAGLSTANAIIPDPEKFARFKAVAKSVAVSTPTILGITALEAAYNEGEPWLEDLIDYLQQNYDFLEGWLADHLPQLKPLRPEGTYLIWLDFRFLGLDKDGLKEFLNTKARVAMDQGAWFGEGGEGFARMNIACHRSTLEQALQRIKQAVEAR